MHIRKRVLVTGGAGFLGSFLCERLLQEGCEVICCDNLYTGSKRNIAHLLNNRNFEFIRHDITFPLYLEVDEIYNLACPASPVHYQNDPVQTTKVNVHGAINMLGLAKRVRAKILQASTSEVYGDPTVHPQTEDYWGNVNCIGLRSCYDEGKRCAETLFFDYHRQHRLNIRVVRIFNTYGPRMHPNDGRVVSSFIMQALTGRDITVFGDGGQTRSFCFVDDLIDGFLKMMDNAEGWIGPVNLGNPHEFTILELAEKVIRLTGSRSRIVRRPLPADDPTQRRPNIDLARHKLGWRPKIELDEGLAATIDYFKGLIADHPALIAADSCRAQGTKTDRARIADYPQPGGRSAYPNRGGGMPVPA
ncbi:MAG: SDR family oxidoreductase [Desulfobacterales bacterium]|nr:SDR family oxidoreductase [Desulfobacterales bacterium]